MRSNEFNIMKQAIEEFAIFGGTPQFEQTLHVGRPNIGNRDSLMLRIDKMLERRWLSNEGPFEKQFEHEIQELTGAKHCIAMCNGTVALEIAVRALGMTGEVIVPSFTFVATAHCLQWQEITPVFCDIDPATYSMDTTCIERLVTPRTTGIIGVHCFGVPCQVDKLQDVANAHGLRLLFDAAHAFGVTHNGTHIGNFGDAEVFSFHATKFINSFEGGAIVTNNDEEAKKIRLMKNFGFEGLDSVIYLGTNGKMNEACAAMGLTSLASIEEFKSRNKTNFHAYQSALKEIPGCTLLNFDESEENNFQYVILDINENAFGLSRNALMKILHAENVRARRYFYPGAHQSEPYRSYYPNAELLLENTVSAASKVLCLPTGTAIGQEDIEGICTLIDFIHNHARDFGAEMGQIA